MNIYVSSNAPIINRAGTLPNMSAILDKGIDQTPNGLSVPSSVKGSLQLSSCDYGRLKQQPIIQLPLASTVGAIN